MLALRTGTDPIATTGPRPATVAVTAAPDPHACAVRRLRGSAAAVGRILDRRTYDPDRWSDPDLALAIDRVRRQLLPIRTLSALAVSWSREHAVADRGVAKRHIACDVRIAYAVRWLELTGVVEERPWSLLVRGSRP